MSILLPTIVNKLAAEWQRFYRIIKRVGEIDYVVHMHDRRRKNQLYHVNMLWKWQVCEPTDTGYSSKEVLETGEGDLLIWGGNDGSTLTEAQLGWLEAESGSKCHIARCTGDILRCLP